MGLLQRAARAMGLAERPAPPAPVERKEPTMTRSFKMAKRDRLTDSWGARSSALDADGEIFRDHETLRQRAREQSINSGLAKRFYRLLKQNVIGPAGIRFQSLAELPDGEADDDFRTAADWEFQKWSKRGNCDVTGRYSFTTFMQLWIETLARDGEVMVRIIRNWPNRWGFALQILEADRLDTSLNNWLDNGNRIRMGVEINEWERPIAYWMLKGHPGDTFVRPGDKWERIPATELRLTFEPWRPHQSRGFTWTHASANEIHHLEEYSHAEQVAAEMGAKITGHYEQDAEWLDEPGDSGDEQGVIEERIEAGTSKLLPYGIKYVPHDSKRPSGNYAPFMKATSRRISAGLGPSYNTLTHDLESVSFSSLRGGSLDDRDFYKVVQQFVISELLEWIGEEWFAMATLKGALRVPPQQFERFSYITWLPRGWDWVDPAKDSKAAVSDYELGVIALSDLIRARGRDPDEVFRQRQADARKLAKLGLSPPKPKEADDAATSDDGEPVNAAGTD